MSFPSLAMQQWSYPLVNPGSAVKRLCLVGDSHTSELNNGATEQRYIYGICRQWPINVHGLFAHAGLWPWTSTPNGGMSFLAASATQHATDGSIAPHEIGQVSGNINGQIFLRTDAVAASFATMRNGNKMNHAALTVKVGWWANAGSYSSIRMRSGFTDDTYTEDTSGISLVGAGAYASRSMPIGADAVRDFRWDSLGANVTGEGNLIGTRIELTSPAGGVSIASIGNGGKTAADYAHATTICSEARWQDWLTMFGPFDRFMVVLGTNMAAAESANIVGVWGPNMLTFAQKLLRLNAAAGGPSDAMVLLITGHDANITTRLSDMAAAIAACANADARIAHYDSARVIQNERGIDYTALAATYLADGVHFNGLGADLVGDVIGDAMLLRTGNVYDYFADYFRARDAMRRRKAREGAAT